MKIVLTICLWMAVSILSAQTSQLKFNKFLGQEKMTNAQWEQFKEQRK